MFCRILDTCSTLSKQVIIRVVGSNATDSDKISSRCMFLYDFCCPTFCPKYFNIPCLFVIPLTSFGFFIT